MSQNKGTFTMFIDGQPVPWGKGVTMTGSLRPAPEPIPEPASRLGTIECSISITPDEQAAWEEFVVQSLTPGVDSAIFMKSSRVGGGMNLRQALWALLERRQPAQYWAFYLKWIGGCRLPRGQQSRPSKRTAVKKLMEKHQ